MSFLGGVIGGAIGGVVGSAIGSLFSRSLSPFDAALSMITQQISVVQEAATAPVRTMVSQVVGGMWVGDGADAFVDELSSILIPGFESITASLTGHSTNLRSANEIMEQADDAVFSLVESTIGVDFNFF